MPLPNKEQIADKLLDFPLIRLLLYERWFRFGFALFVLIFIFLGLFLPKIWTSSRPDFRPVIKVSGLDLVQAWSLKRTALREVAAGKFENANYAWQAALANNRADPRLVRGALECVLKDPHGTRLANQAIQESFWLLRLTRTNVVDLELASRVLERFQYFEPIIQFVESTTNQLTRSIAPNYLKALFHLGRVAQFERCWTNLAGQLDSDPEMKLYQDAYLVGWGDPGTISHAREELDKATEDPNQRILAYQLKLELSAHQLDPDQFGHALAKLEEWRADTLPYHLAYWRLLIEAGRKEEAAKLLQSYAQPPSSPVEVVQLADIYERLDMRDRELQLLHRYVGEFGNAPMFWIPYVNALTAAKRWDDLRNLALQIRGQDAVRDSLGAFSYFMEGRAELALNRDANAQAAFEKAAQGEFPFPLLGYGVASQLLQVGYPQLAKKVLAGLEKPLESELGYWNLLFSVGERLKDMDLMLRAGRRAFELAPQNPLVMNNYAAVLIINRQDPEEAIKLTMQLYVNNPDSLHAVVNHSAALLLNDRPKQAEALLGNVKTNMLDRSQMALYQLDLFEAYMNLQEYDRARMIVDRIDTSLLYPPQKKWFNQARQKLPSKDKG